jgi:hypothetical protein
LVGMWLCRCQQNSTSRYGQKNGYKFHIKKDE